MSDLLAKLGIDLPIIQAPMAGSDSPQLAAAVSEIGGLGSIGAAAHSAQSLVDTVQAIRATTDRAFNLNFFCHTPPAPDTVREAAWLKRLAPYYAELGATPPTTLVGGRAPFDAEALAVIEALRPPVVSFHFGLPAEPLYARVQAIGCAILASATSPDEARWLEARGVTAIIAQGAEAGGHHGVFLKDWRTPGGMIGTMALVPQVVDAVRVPVIAAGGIADGRGITAAFALGASAVQIGTAYLQCPESAASPLYRAALATGDPNNTAMTNVVTGRPARGLLTRMMRELGPIAADAPEFPTGAPASQPLRRAAEAKGSTDFTPLWSGQHPRPAHAMPAAELTLLLAGEANQVMETLGR